MGLQFLFRNKQTCQWGNFQSEIESPDPSLVFNTVNVTLSEPHKHLHILKQDNQTISPNENFKAFCQERSWLLNKHLF